MQAIDRPFTKIINGSTQFVIPVFQRDYNWTEAECEQLWQDILQIASDQEDRAHFLGSIVYVCTGGSSAGFTQWLLIDGQQRVTTLTLLLIALRDHIIESEWEGTEDGPTANRIDAYFLKNLQEQKHRNHKLVLRRHDQATLHALIDGQELPANPSERITENYEFFREAIKESDPEFVYQGIGRLVVVDVTLNRNTDDPQLIFESLNSTGMDLSQSDLIRNFILMRLPEQEQTRLYENYWSKIEDLFRESGKTFDAFVRDYLALKTQASKQDRADEIYFSFRRTFGSIGHENSKLDNFLKEMLRFARYHAAFSVGVDAPEPLGKALAYLRRLVDVPAILVMRLYECYDQAKTLNEQQFVEAVGLIESYVFRRAICGEQTRGYWQVFANMAYRINHKRPLESLKIQLARQRDKYRFPENDEFRKALEENDIFAKRVCFQLLDRLENHDNKEPTDTTNYSIEHIMPRNKNLPSRWRKMLGSNWQDVHQEWLHRLGNLTLTGYNSTYKDRPFEEKKKIPGGFNDSSIRLNKFVREQPVWTASEMEHRGKQLAKKSITVWPALVVDKALVDAAEREEMRSRAMRRDVGNVPMSQRARELFEHLRVKVKDIDSEVIEIAEQKSVSYHGPAFFLEILPRKRKLVLLLDMDFNEIQDPYGIAIDASERQFFFYAQYEGGVCVPIRTEDEIDMAIPLIRQAHEMGAT